MAAATAAAASLLLRRRPLLHARALQAVHSRCIVAGFSTADASHSQDDSAVSASEGSPAVQVSPKAPSSPPPTRPLNPWLDQPEYRKWKEREAKILEDIEPIVFLTKDILHSNRYKDGECLNAEDEKEVTEKLLAYHPHSEDKIGSGIDSIMVDRHPQFRQSRCLFVVRTDGVWIDFSYQKCLRAYIKEKYPTDAERFIREHFKRS